MHYTLNYSKFNLNHLPELERLVAGNLDANGGHSDGATSSLATSLTLHQQLSLVEKYTVDNEQVVTPGSLTIEQLQSLLSLYSGEHDECCKLNKGANATGVVSNVAGLVDNATGAVSNVVGLVDNASGVVNNVIGATVTSNPIADSVSNSITVDVTSNVISASNASDALPRLTPELEVMYQQEALLHYQFTVATPSKSYPISIGSNLINDPAYFAQACQDRQVLVVTNSTLAQLHLDRLLQTLRPLCRQLETVVVIDSEQAKTQPYLDQIYTKLLECNYSRNALIIAFGGGVVGDLAGYAAATYQRGISCLQIPTSLLAQVDSSVGGKTAINHALGKNMIGAFLQPDQVIIDINLLTTLAPREFSAGLAEVIKYGLLAGFPVLHEIARYLPRLTVLEPQALAHIVHLCCQIKAQVVAQDEEERGCRALLNLGHTYGHAIEGFFKYDGTWLHGEAVAVGILLAYQTAILLAQGLTQDLTQESSQQPPQDTVQRLSHALSKEPVQKTAQDLVQESSQDTGQKSAHEPVQGWLQQLSQDYRSKLKLAYRIVKLLLQQAGLPTTLPTAMTANDFLRYMVRDKKNLAQQIVLIVPTSLGTATKYSHATHELITQAITSLHKTAVTDKVTKSANLNNSDYFN